MDETNNKISPDTGEDISLGGGVDLVQSNSDVDDVEIETYNDDIVSGGEMTAADRMKRLREQLAIAVNEKQEYLDGWQRAKADFVNYKKREDESKAEFLKYAREELVVDLIPVLESFNMAFANKAAWEKVDPQWRTGVEYIHTQLEKVLGEHGVTRLAPKPGDDFDPAAYTSVGNVETSDTPLLHKVAELVSPGYRLGEKVVRSPQVKVYADHSS